MEPYAFLDKYRLKRSLFKDCESLAGIDRGNSLTKIVFIPKKYEKSEEEWIELWCTGFLNKKFVEGLQYLRQESCLKDGDILRITGIAIEKYIEQIEEVAKVKTILVDEFLTQITGTQFLLANLSPDQLFYPDIESTIVAPVPKGTFALKFDKMTKEVTDREISKDSFGFPQIFAFLGSAAGYMQLYDEKNSKMIETQMVSGKAFMGLASVLLGTTDYKEICDLAAEGTGRTTDLFFTDLLPSNYPCFSMETDSSVFAFGKLANDDVEYTRQDVANSLIKLITQCIVASLIECCMRQKLNRIVLGGNFVRSEQIRKGFVDSFTLMMGKDCFHVKFINTGQTGAIGAMLTSPEQLKELLKETSTPKLQKKEMH